MRTVVKVSVVAALFAATSVSAAEPPLQISYPADATLDCAGLQGEIVKMEEILGISADQAASAQGSARMAEAGASAAINGALYSGALGKVPGLGAFGNAAAGFAKNRAAAKEAEAKERARTAETRRAMLMGMYAGKSCATAAPAEAPAAVAAPAS